MAYLVNTPKLAAVSINGVDYTDNFVSFQCADDSANRNGLLAVKGSLTLGLHPGGLDISTYRGRLFRRGHVVLIDIKYPPSTIVRHPRGYLYVISTTYEPEADQVVLELGCKLSLMQLTDNIDALLSFVEVPLSEERQTYSNIASALAFTGHVVYQDNTGALQKRKYFPNNVDQGTVPANTWVSILGTSALAVSPLSGSGALPDAISISYDAPLRPGEGGGEIIIDETRSLYPIRFPIKVMERKPPSTGVAGVTSSSATSRSGPLVSDCGNTPDLPTNDPTAGRENDTESCSENFEVVDTVTYLNGVKTAIQKTYNDGPGGQTRLIEQFVYGPPIEVNSQYYTDKYAYCVSTYSSSCIPSGLCQPSGTGSVLQSKSIQEYFYNGDGSLARTVTSEYANVGSAGQPTDWRSVYTNTATGLEQQVWRGAAFEAVISSGRQYLVSRTIEETRYGAQGNVRITTRYSSVDDYGVGLSNIASLDAMRGIKTVERRTSKTISTNPLLPDRGTEVDTAAVETTSIQTTFPVFVNTYVTPPEEAGPYIQQESLPIELEGYTRRQLDTAVNKYGRYLVSWAKAEALGLSVSEALRPAISTGWHPGQTFRYKDVSSGELLTLIADACAWAVEDDGAVVTMKGGWLGVSNGVVTLPSNLVGNSQPVIPEDVTDETAVNSGSLSFVVSVVIGVQPEITLGGKNNLGIVVKWPKVAGGNEVAIEQSCQCYVNAQIVGPGSLVSLEGNGGIPLSSNGILLTGSATVIDPNIL